jgi:UMF1 family MFS transporter
MLVHLAPADRVGEFFGLYAIAGTVTVWLGPLLVELFTKWSGDQRIGMSAIALLFVLGLIVLTTVNSPHHPAVEKK